MRLRILSAKTQKPANATSLSNKSPDSEKEASRFPAMASSRERLLSLQRTHGNRTVQRIIGTYSQITVPRTDGWPGELSVAGAGLRVAQSAAARARSQIDGLGGDRHEMAHSVRAPSSVEGRKSIARELARVLHSGSEHPVIRRKIKLATQPPVREDPIDKILRGEPAVGLTTPTVNGGRPTDFQDAEKRLNNALTPKQTSYDPKTSECTINDFDVSISAIVQIFTEPKDDKWRKYVPGSSLRNAEACKDLENVPVVMKGKPNSDAVEKLVAANEQEHVDDLKSLYGQHLEPHFKELTSLKGKGDSSKTCSDDIRATAASKRAVAITNFLQAWRDSVTNRDADGKHTLKTRTTVKGKCVRVEIEAEKR